MSTTQAWPTIIGAGAVILSLIAQSMLARRFARVKHRETAVKLEAIEASVNGTATAQVARIDQLEQTIINSNATLPANPPKEDA